jgi:peptide/nickel transport system permease protein
MLAGLIVGLVSGYLGGILDEAVRAALDVLLAFPFILLALLLVTVLGPSLRNAMFAVTLAVFPKDARLIRAEVLSLKEREFVIAAHLAGVGRLRTIRKHLLPNVLPIALIVASTDVGLMIAATAGLSFLGLGVQAPAVDWGTLISDGSSVIATTPSLVLLPTACVALVSLAFLQLADDLRSYWGTRS